MEDWAGWWAGGRLGVAAQVSCATCTCFDVSFACMRARLSRSHLHDAHVRHGVHTRALRGWVRSYCTVGILGVV